MYPSDYAYTYAYGVDNICYEKGFNCTDNKSGKPASGWLYDNKEQWLISPYSDLLHLAFRVNISGYVISNSSAIEYAYNVRPTVYLKADVKILDGNGKKETPYQLSL